MCAKKPAWQKGKYYKPPMGEEVEARDTGSEGDQTTYADNNTLYPQTALHVVCGVLSNTSNTVG